MKLKPTFIFSKKSYFLRKFIYANCDERTRVCNCLLPILSAKGVRFFFINQLVENRNSTVNVKRKFTEEK